MITTYQLRIKHNNISVLSNFVFGLRVLCILQLQIKIYIIQFDKSEYKHLLGFVDVIRKSNEEIR